MTIRKTGFTRPAATLISASMLSPMLFGCGGGNQAAPPPIDRSGTRNLPPAVGAPQVNNQGGMSTKKKLVMLAGAAALYYMWKKKQNADGQSMQYYRSETNGRIYYRDPKNPKQAIYVTPPQRGIMVPADEARQYNDYQGYNRSPEGQTFGGYGANGPVGGAVPQPMR